MSLNGFCNNFDNIHWIIIYALTLIYFDDSINMNIFTYYNVNNLLIQ